MKRNKKKIEDGYLPSTCTILSLTHSFPHAIFLFLPLPFVALLYGGIGLESAMVDSRRIY